MICFHSTKKGEKNHTNNQKGDPRREKEIFREACLEGYLRPDLHQCLRRIPTWGK